MRALVTGGNGFVGQWLVREMIRRGWTVTSAGPRVQAAVDLLKPEEREQIVDLLMDVTDGESVSNAIERSLPDTIIHLAGISYVPDAASAPARAFDVNVTGMVRLLSKIRVWRNAGVIDPVVVVVGSGEQYGRHEGTRLPLREDTPQHPLSVYAASKAAQEVAALQAFRSEGMKVICTRSFSHSGFGHAPQFLLPSLVRRAVQLRGRPGALSIGNGDTVRDLLHVRDVVDAYLKLAESGVAGEVYNVCSGIGISVRSLAERVLARVGITAEVVQAPNLMRKVDVPVSIGDNTKLQRAADWRPEMSVDDIIDDLINAATR
jgi:nucleoside-diphosphate-sugar epimerase